MLYGTSEKSLRKYSRSTIKVYFIFLMVKQARRFCHLPFCNSCLASKSIFALLVLAVSCTEASTEATGVNDVKSV